MTRVLFVTDVFPPSIGGPATFFDHLGHALAKQGHAVTVVCSSSQPTDPADTHRPFRVRRISANNRMIRALKIRLLLAQEMFSHRVILINGLENPTAQIAALFHRRYILRIAGDYVWEMARNSGLTDLSIDDFQSAVVDDPLLRRIARTRERYTRQATLIITPSQYLRRTIIGWGIAPERVVTVLNGVHCDEFAAFEPRRRDGTQLNVIFVGRLTNWKGVDTLLRALRELRDVRATIVGDGPEMASLRALARELQLDERVTFAGAQPRDAVQSYVAQSDALVLISSYEGLSHTLLEACAMGVPCIASNCGGNPEVIQHMENGLLVPCDDVPQLQSALGQLQRDEELRYRLACRAKDSSRRFDFETTVRETTRILLAQ
jgi:glycosyltransferase involved in cell wall biosynthesis